MLSSQSEYNVRVLMVFSVGPKARREYATSAVTYTRLASD